MEDKEYYIKLIKDRLQHIFYYYSDLKQTIIQPFEIEEDCSIDIELELIFESNKNVYLNVRIDPDDEEIEFRLGESETMELLNRNNLFEYFAIKYLRKQE